MEHNRKYLEAKYVIENPKEYDPRDVVDAKRYCNAYEDGLKASKNIDDLHGVSDQRELLISFFENLKSKVGEYRIRTILTTKAVDSFLKESNSR